MKGCGAYGPTGAGFDLHFASGGSIWTSMKALIILCMMFWASALSGQELSALARLDASGSQIRDTGTGVEVTLALSQPVPWRGGGLAGPLRVGG